MAFTEQDSKLQAEIRAALFERLTINANKDIGVAYLQAEPADRVNPSVVITKDEIRARTGRLKVRDVVLADYRKALSSQFLSVEQGKALKVSVVPERLRQNDFASLSKLKAQNADDLSEDPDLGEPLI